jgi:hypothetical protein
MDHGEIGTPPTKSAIRLAGVTRDRCRFSIRLASGPCTAIDQTGRCTTPPYPCAVTDGADRHYPNPGSQLAADKGGFVGYDLGDTSLGLTM